MFQIISARNFTNVTGANLPQVIVRIDAGVVSVVPIDSYGVVANFFHMQHFNHGLVHLERILIRFGIVCFLGLSAVGTRTAGTGAFIAQIGKGIFA